MYLWKLISVPFNEKHSINAGQINDLELKNQLDLLKIQGWEVVRMLAIACNDGTFFDFLIELKCEVIPFPVLRRGFYPISKLR